ncbi:MAG: sigma-54-dependent Fis family transcriptional regulator [Planctomycetes bacterium]|nr:sigma-54-dependent Fis family transcriptional regulator [Planctomycetota bacterium]
MTIERVLVLEREGTPGESLEQLLVQEGYQVLRARDVAQAARLLRAGPVHCCVFEIHPTLVDVRDLIEKSRTLLPKVPRILCIAPRDLERMQSFVDCGDELLLKPATRSHLAAILQRYKEAARQKAEADHIWQRLFGAESAEALLNEPRGMRDVVDRAAKVAAERGTVLVQGPRGSGKSLVARLIHEKGPSKAGAFLAMKCARTQGSLQESELFGHEPGAFPGANETVAGSIELAQGGTLVLEEIWALSMDVQHRLYRFLQGGQMRRMGGQRSFICPVRIVATSSRNLQSEVQAGRMAPDLLRRVATHVVTVPSLVDRKFDIAILAKRFLRESPAYGTTSVRGIAPETVSTLSAHDWPGNVAELRQVVERMVLADPAETLMPEHVAIVNPGERDRALEQAVGMTVAEMEREMILRSLEKTKGNRTAASKLLGLTTRTLSNKIRIYRAQGFTIIGGRKKKPATTMPATGALIPTN